MKNYIVPSPSGGEMTIQLDDDEAKSRGLVETKAATPPANKAAKKPRNKSV